MRIQQNFAFQIYNNFMNTHLYEFEHVLDLWEMYSKRVSQHEVIGKNRNLFNVNR